MPLTFYKSCVLNGRQISKLKKIRVLGVPHQPGESLNFLLQKFVKSQPKKVDIPDTHGKFDVKQTP